MTKIIFEQHGLTCTIEKDADTIDEVMELVKYALAGLSFSENTINKYFNGE